MINEEPYSDVLRQQQIEDHKLKQTHKQIGTYWDRIEKTDGFSYNMLHADPDQARMKCLCGSCWPTYPNFLTLP